MALNTSATEVLFGGAAGGGKSHLMRVAAVLWCASVPGLQVYLFRRIRDDLVKNHMEGPKGLRSMLARWANAGFVTIVEDEIRFWNGSKIYLCHCKDEKDIYKYQGAEIHVLLLDEVTHFTETMYRFLRNRVRMVGITLPEQYRGKFPRILASGNPGNIGHLFVKATFIDDCKPMEIRQMPANEGGMLRQFIPARLDDNPSMAEDDPGYGHRLEGLGSKALVQAMRHGDWDVVDGAFFDCWAKHRHVVRPFKIPQHWTRIVAGDWGSAKPFSFGWYAVASDDVPVGGDLILPRGGLVRYREWYGIKTEPDGKYQPNVGLKLFAEKVGEGLVQRCLHDEKIDNAVIDPSTFDENGGPSIVSRIHSGTKNRIGFRRADNRRIAQRGAMGGWDQVRARLEGEAEDRPMLVFFDTCIHAIRTIPVLQHDKDRPEDLDTDGEDHAADEVRYACMSRPWAKDRIGDRYQRDRYSRSSSGESSWMSA